MRSSVVAVAFALALAAGCRGKSAGESFDTALTALCVNLDWRAESSVERPLEEAIEQLKYISKLRERVVADPNETSIELYGAACGRFAADIAQARGYLMPLAMQVSAVKKLAPDKIDLQTPVLDVRTEGCGLASGAPTTLEAALARFREQRAAALAECERRGYKRQGRPGER